MLADVSQRVGTTPGIAHLVRAAARGIADEYAAEALRRGTCR